jgi:hypothetical protein
MQCFRDEIEKLVRARVPSPETALAFATNAGNLHLQLDDMMEPEPDFPSVAARFAPAALGEANNGEASSEEAAVETKS